jgi:hypothetical protein
MAHDELNRQSDLVHKKAHLIAVIKMDSKEILKIYEK